MKSFNPKFALIFLLFLSVGSAAAEDCGEISKTSEALLNLQLGMSVNMVKTRFSRLKLKVKNDQDYRFFKNYINKKPPLGLEGVRALYLRFFEKKLYQIEIFWEENKYPAVIKDFAETVSKQMNLPLDDWKFAHRQATLRCGKTSLAVDYQLNPRIELTDLNTEEKLSKLKKQNK